MTKVSPIVCGAFLLCSASVFLSLFPALVHGGEAGSLQVAGESMSAGTQWTIVATYSIPEGASGLAYDGSYLYFGIYGANGSEIYRLDPDTGNYELRFLGPQQDAFGLTYDGQFLWATDHAGSSSTPAFAMQFDLSGGSHSQFDLPAHYMSGIAYDDGDFWVARYYPDPSRIYKVDASGTILDEFTAPDDQPWDLCMQSDKLWIADYYGDTLYQIDPTSGAVLFSHSSEGSDPAGIVWDGDHLWYCDNGEGTGQDFLYKVDLAGGGAPEINIPVAAHDFGTVPIGEQVTWNLTVQNLGPADLNISAVTFGPPDDLSSPDSFPVVIPPMDSGLLAVVYTPDGFDPLNATATVHSNDPIHPESEISLIGHGVYPGPAINVVEGAHDYGQVRVDANTRWFLEIRNEGSETLTVSDILSDDLHFYLDDTTSLPADISPLSSIEFGVWFNPDQETSFSAALTVHSNDAPQSPSVVPCSGVGVCTDYTAGQVLWSYSVDAPFNASPRVSATIPDLSVERVVDTVLSAQGFGVSSKAIAAIPDISGDGVADVIVSSEDDIIRCFNGSSDGTGDVLWEHEIYAGSLFMQNALQITEDIDNDGYHDVVVGAAWGGRLIRAISGRTGETIWTHDTHEYGDGGWVYQVHYGYDYNGDGVSDVLAATGDDGNNTGPKRVYCLDGLTGVSIWERPLSGPGFAVIGVEDFTGDGQPDVVVGASSDDESEGRAYGINGADGSIEWTFPVSGSTVWAVEQIDDITEDGVRDIIVGDFGGTVYGLDATDGTQVYSSGGYGLIVRFERLDDVNGDGHPDILPAHFGNMGRAIDGQTGDPIWSTPLVDKSAAVARIADVTNDGVNDVLIGTLFNNNFVYLLDGTDGSVLEDVNYGTPVDSIAAIPDIVGEGLWEIVAGGRNGVVTCFSGSTGNPCDNPTTGPEIVHGQGQEGDTRPCSGYIDPRAESTDGVNFNQGLDTVALLFSEPVFAIGGGPVGPADFVVTESGSAVPPTVAVVNAEANPLIVVTLDRFITVREWTTIRAVVQNASGIPIQNLGDLGPGVIEPDRWDGGALPGDVDTNGLVSPLDLLRFRQYVNMIVTPECGILVDYVDTTRDGVISPFDLLRFRQTINGVTPPSTQAWASVTMLNTQP